MNNVKYSFFLKGCADNAGSKSPDAKDELFDEEDENGITMDTAEAGVKFSTLIDNDEKK